MKKTLLEDRKISNSAIWARANPEKALESQRRVRNTLRGSLNSKVSAARQRAKNKGLEFDISIEFVRTLWETQDGRCALTGMKMGIRAERNSQESFNSVSIDRINSKKGYTKDNIQLICWGVNSCKSNMNLETFFKFVKSVYDFNELGDLQ